MKNKIRKISSADLIEAQIVFALIERFLIQIIGMPNSIIYIIDILNMWLLMYLIKRKKWTKYVGLVIAYSGIVFLALIVGLINYREWGGNIASSLIEIRNITRFPIFFLACAEFLNEKTTKKIYKFLTTFFAINTIIILYQYFTFHPPGVWMRGDMLNGLFGTETGGNTFVNVILIVVVTYLLSCWINKEKTVISFGVAVGASLLMAALIELKAFFVEVIVIYGFYLIKKRKTKKEIVINVLLITAAAVISVGGLQIMYKEYPWFKDSMSIAGFIKQLSGNGYTGDGDLNRFTGVFTIASKIFGGDIGQILFGIGAGNASQTRILGSRTVFFDFYERTHYNWFSATYMFVQGGMFTLLTYLFTFVYLFFKRKRYKQFELNTQIMCILAVFLVFYGEALRTDAGYFVYFAIASGFVKSKSAVKVDIMEERNNDERYRGFGDLPCL